MHIVEKPPTPPLTTAQFAAIEFKAATAFAQMSKEARQRIAQMAATQVYEMAQMAIEIVAQGKAQLIEKVQADPDLFDTMIGPFNDARERARQLLDVIADAQCRLLVALAVVEGDDSNPPDGDNGEPAAA
jgi:hypothetical protein